MPTITLSLPVASQNVSAGLHASNYAALQALLNGGLDGSNISAAAALALSANGITLGGLQAVRGQSGSKWQIVEGSSVVTTDAAGDTPLINYGITFAIAPTPLICNGDGGVGLIDMGVKGWSTTGFNVRTSTVSNPGIRINWIALGTIA